MTDEVEGICKWCGDEGIVWADTGYCQDCDSDIVHCLICDEDQHAHDHCRHVFQDEHFEWVGSGTGRTPDQDIENAVHALLGAMPRQFSISLRKAVREGRFYSFFVAPMIGGGATFTLHGLPFNRRWKWEDQYGELGYLESESIETGYRWLASLYENRTPEANAQTVGMISRFLEPPTSGKCAEENSK